MPWQQALMSLARTLLSFQRAVRLTALAQSQSLEELWRELQNGGSDAMEEPDWLLIQVWNHSPVQDMLVINNDVVSKGGQRFPCAANSDSLRRGNGFPIFQTKLRIPIKHGRREIVCNRAFGVISTRRRS
jgi:hypothetical protein